MKLSDLLDTAREEAPAARYTVDDVVKAGRRRIRRRNTGWAIAALLAVFAAIGVPQLVARPSVPPAVAPKAGPFDLRFSAYTSGDLRVGDPEWVSPVSQTASIGREVSPGEYRSVGKIVIYRAGYFPMNLGTQTGGDPIEPINGREASLFTVPTNTAYVSADSLLFWRYADDSVGVLASFRKRLTRAEMVRVASAFRLTAPRPARLPFSVSFVPPGLRLVAVEVSRAKTATALLKPEATDGIEFNAGYEQAKFVSEWSEPGPGSKEQPVDSSVPRSTPGSAPAPTGSVVIGVQLSFVPGTGPTSKCAPFPRQTSVTACRLAPDDTSYVVTLGGGDVPLDYTKRVGREVQVVGRGIHAMRTAENPDTWPTVREAFPTSAQVTRD